MLFSLTPLAKPFFRAATCNPVDRNGKFPLQPKPVSYLCTDSVTIQPIHIEVRVRHIHVKIALPATCTALEPGTQL